MRPGSVDLWFSQSAVVQMIEFQIVLSAKIVSLLQKFTGVHAVPSNNVCPMWSWGC